MRSLHAHVHKQEKCVDPQLAYHRVNGEQVDIAEGASTLFVIEESLLACACTWPKGGIACHHGEHRASDDIVKFDPILVKV